MPRSIRLAVLLGGVALALCGGTAQASASSPDVAALQVALRAEHLYRGSIDGIDGPMTRGATQAFQRKHHLVADGIAGPKTRHALGRRGGPNLGSRVMRTGDR